MLDDISFTIKFLIRKNIQDTEKIHIFKYIQIFKVHKKCEPWKFYTLILSSVKAIDYCEYLEYWRILYSCAFPVVFTRAQFSSIQGIIGKNSLKE